MTLTLEYPSAGGWGSLGRRVGRGKSSPAVDLAAAAKDTAELTLPTVTLGPYSTGDEPLDAALGQLPQPIPYGSIRIQYDGAPGSVAAEVSSVDQSKDMVVDAKIQNEGNGWAGSGANPWHLDNETESFVFLTDMGNKAAHIGFKIWASGMVYYVTTIRLLPRETRMINLRALRDAQTTDLKGNKIPAGATDGSVLWIRVDNVPVMGRVVVINRNGGVASSYDCCDCPCPASFEGYTVALSSFTLALESTQQETSNEETQNCNSDTFNNDVTDDSDWTSGDTAVITVSDSTQPGLAKAVGGGTATANASMTAYVYPRDGQQCNQQEVPAQSSGTATVPQTPGYVKIYSNTASTFQCPGTTKNVPDRLLYYQALDNSSQKNPIANATVNEYISLVQHGSCTPVNGCGKTPVEATWTTGSNGVINSPGDTIANCSSTCLGGGQCTETWEQTFTVSGTSVQIINGSTTGSQNCWTATCSSPPSGVTQ